MFTAVHVYFPSMSFAVFGNSSDDPFLIYLSMAFDGRVPPLNVHITVGFGIPQTLQVKLAVLPLVTVWFLRASKI